MKLSLTLAVAAAVVASAAATSQAAPENFHSHAHPRVYYEDKFLTWMTEYGMAFSDSEYEVRLRTFAQSEDRIEKHNAKPNATFSMAHNPFSHMTWPEFKASKAIGRPLQSKPARIIDIKPPSSGAVSRRAAAKELPESWDWGAQGAVTPVKNQGSCGSCWSFSSTGAMEGAYFVKNKHLVSFSEQMLVDCDNLDSGCGGGLMDYSFQWIQENGGICAEDDYPYTAAGGVCAASACTPVPGTAVKGWVDVESSQEALKAAVVQQPVSVAIEADEMDFQLYKDGVLTAGCGTSLDHGVLLTGYGVTENGVKYWLVKNSWGPEWGSSGYIKLLRGASQEGGECGILMQASYPELA